MDIPDTHFIRADWLAERLDRPGLVPGRETVDTRKSDDHASAHIPGARKLALDPHLHHPDRVEDPEVFARVRNYEGSWAEWSWRGMPRVVEPASAPESDKG